MKSILAFALGLGLGLAMWCMERSECELEAEFMAAEQDQAIGVLELAALELHDARLKLNLCCPMWLEDEQ